MNLFTVGHQGVPEEWVVMLPARQLPDAPDGAVHGA